MASREQFTISYGGEALEAGLMDVRDLAPALLAVGDLLQETNRLVNQGRATVSVQVRSDFTKGSFDVALVVVQGILEQAQEFLKIHPHIKDAKELLEMLFFYGGLPYGLFKLLKALAGRQVPKEGVTFQNDGDVIINIGNDKVHTTRDVYNLATNPSVRVAVERMVAPLQTEGIDLVSFSEGGKSEVITKEEAAFFRAGDVGEETLIDNVREAVVAIVRLSFRPEHKWGFSDGTVRISASIEDRMFWDRVASGEPFSKGDQLRLRIRTKTTRKENGDLKSDYTVEQVLEHIPRRRATQIPME